MSKPLVTILGKSVQKAARLRGGGSALPGLVVEKIDPNFISHTLSSLPYGVAIVSGTNGKTTTTKAVVEILEAQGLKVFTNRTGSNFTRGVAAALLGSINIKGQLKADVAILELDEAHALQFVKKIKPDHCLILNVMRDQLDRFGEIDHTANLLRQVAEATSLSVTLNREDPRIANLATSLGKQKVNFFGLNSSLKHLFPTDDELRSSKREGGANPSKASVTLEEFSESSAKFKINGENIETTLKLNGAYNMFNLAAAIAFAQAILGKGHWDLAKLKKVLPKIEPAFGRGEKLIVGGQPLEIVLVKNPSGFRLALQSFDSKNYKTMIAINDNYADGRDMSWLWDVDFDSLRSGGVAVVGGIRAYDMALRLNYDEVKIDHIHTPVDTALKVFLKNYKSQPKRIYCTYTAMLSIRKLLAKKAKLEVIK